MTANLSFVDIAGVRTAYREWEGPGDDCPSMLCLHGYPTSSYLWRNVAPHLASVGRVIAPDFPGFGDSELGGRLGTWEELVQFVDDFVTTLDLAPLHLVVHDWGGLIGLWWLTEHSDKVDRLVITDTGFFSDGRWHGMALTLRTPNEGEALMDAMTEDGATGMLQAMAPAMPAEAAAEYWKGLATPERRAAKLAMYRSGDFEKLAGREHKLGEFAKPTCIIWGAADVFAPVGGGYRFQKRIPNAEMHVLEGVGHFLQEDVPDEVGRLAAEFLRA